MRYILFFPQILLLLFFIPSCSYKDKIRSVKADYLVYSDIERHQGVLILRQKIKPYIDTIIKEELALPAHATIGLQIPMTPTTHRELFRLALYYINRFRVGQEGYLLDELAVLAQSKPAQPTNLALMPKGDFFGQQQERVAVIVNDPTNSLYTFHLQIQSALHRAFTAYGQCTGEPLYSVPKSERYPYIPHITLGVLPLGAIVQQAEQQGIHADLAIQAIKSRIKKELFPQFADWLGKTDRTIHLTGFQVKNKNEEKLIKQFDIWG